MLYVKMSNWLIALIMSGVIAFLMVITESNENNKNAGQNKMTYAIKVFVISWLTIYCCLTFFGTECEVKPDIEVGEPPF